MSESQPSQSGPIAFHGPNSAYARDLYEQWRRDPASVDPDSRSLFDHGFVPPDPASPVSSDVSMDRVMRASRLARLIRARGHTLARLDPLGSEPTGDAELELTHHGLTEGDLAALPSSLINGPVSGECSNALDAVRRLKDLYCGTVGYEIDHVQSPEERVWLREAVELRRFSSTIDDDDRRNILESLTEVDTFEQYLHRTQPFQGEKRFSIEGVDAVVPVVQALLHEGLRAGSAEAVIGMAHRGRLNVLAHVLKKPYAKILGEFLKNQRGATKTRYVGMTGDVKYHQGYERTIELDGGSLHVTLAPNPSHLEFVNPVVMGRARAAQEIRGKAGKPDRDILGSLCIVIHGDAAFPGQGVVAESLNLSRIAGYRVGGTLHIIANNQVGFTTEPRHSRSTLYASDPAKGFEIPIVHVNADDPEACVAVARMAFAYRQRFAKDFLIDLVGYRRHGHNETDEPRYTQPMMYRSVDNHPRLREIWANRMVSAGLVDSETPSSLVDAVRERLNAARDLALEQRAAEEPVPPKAKGAGKAPATAVGAQRLRAVNEAINSVPDGFHVHEKLERSFLRPRRLAFDTDEPSVNWAHAEALAFGTILQDGVAIRLSGQDSQRGTFSQRMLVLHDGVTGERHNPLHVLPGAKAPIAVCNSPLSETAVLGFEYGYSIHAKDCLVLWEAQFGDFANGAQVIIDQFLAAGKAKWGQSPGLVLLLPHGSEGQGPEHSSARPERFLQLCAEDNLRIANCTTPAQYFHILRRQAASLSTADARPLVLMTPKSLLRHPKAMSNLADLASDRFEPVLDDARYPEGSTEVTRLVLCSGKVHVDLVAGSDYADSRHVAIARVEELYPFPVEALDALVRRYPNLVEVCWVQEEPRNMGAWSFVAMRLPEILPDGLALRYIGRIDGSSPAEGSTASYLVEQARIVGDVFSSPRETGNRNGANATR
ncbi:MAG: 2-oxoglutarate dehydrogenase E1 component [Armatimonadota bacterium]